MYKNVIIYQLKDSNGQWDDVRAYIPSDQNDYIRCCEINANDKNIFVFDIKDFNSLKDIYEEMKSWMFSEEIIVTNHKIYDAKEQLEYIY